MKNNIFKSRRFKHGTLATVMTVVFVAAVVLVNVIATILLEKFPLSIDLTQDQSFQMAEDSKEFLKELDTEVQIHVLIEESEFSSAGNFYVTQIHSVLKQCTQYSSKVSLDFINFEKRPSYGKNEDGTYKYGNALQSGNIIVEATVDGDLRYKIFSSLEDFIEYDTSTYEVSESHAEADIIGAILIVTDKKPIQVANLTGFQENGAAGLVAVMEKNGYTFTDVNIMTEEIPAGTEMILIAAPTVDYTQKEIDKVEKFLANSDNYGKNLIYVASYIQEDLPILEGYLKNDWKLEIGNGIIMETNQSNMYGGYFYTLHTLTGNQFVDTIPDYANVPVYMPAAVPIKGLDENTTTTLISTADSCVLQPENATEDWDYTKETKQTFDTAVISKRERYKDGSDYVQSNVIVFGSEGFFVQEALEMETFYNGDFTLEMVNTLSGKETNTLDIINKSQSQETLGVTDDVTATMRTIFMIIVPVATFAIGLVVWLRRKNK